MKIGRVSIKINFLIDDDNDENNVKSHKCIMLRTLRVEKENKFVMLKINSLDCFTLNILSFEVTIL